MVVSLFQESKNEVNVYLDCLDICFLDFRNVFLFHIGLKRKKQLPISYLEILALYFVFLWMARKLIKVTSIILIPMSYVPNPLSHFSSYPIFSLFNSFTVFNPLLSQIHLHVLKSNSSFKNTYAPPPTWSFS